ncbi:MAG: guanylyltransferase [Methanobrevibacter sp.]|nr:guanylyltransferase [Methanobrevibacter sp.]
MMEDYKIYNNFKDYKIYNNFKDYEIYNNLKVPKDSNIILRLDGRNFHTLANKISLKKPYDKLFSMTMVDTSKDIFNEFAPLFIYTFSDEINILLSEIPFSGRIEKLNSVFPSLASSSFLKHLNRYFSSNEDEKSIIDDEKSIIDNEKFSNEDEKSINNEKSIIDNENIIISFDSRLIPIANNKDIVKYFKWRQDESWRNCVNSYGYWTLRQEFSKDIATEKLKNLKSSDIHELLFEKGSNLNDVVTYQKRGIAIYKYKEKITGFNPKINDKDVSYRNRLYVDKDLATFDENFFKKINII